MMSAAVTMWVLCSAVSAAAAAADAEREQHAVRVYVLAGQSNMEGKAKNKLWEHQATDEATRDVFAHLRDGEGWVRRDDVWIKYLSRHGALTLGYGSPERTGVEFEFGSVIGDHHDQPVLLIKTAWGGHSLYKQFRSPSNPPSEERVRQDLEKQVAGVQRRNQQRNENRPLPTLDQVRGEYGASYAAMIDEVKSAEANLGMLFPELKGRRFDVSGFFWFQGWNDQYNGAETEYAENMRHLINDVRRDFNQPRLPVVIAVMGQNMSNPAQKAMKVIQEAQLSMEDVPEFAGTVRSVRTDVLVDKAAEELYPSWKENLEIWERTGSDRPYHYLGSAIWMLRIGHECALAMIELESSRQGVAVSGE